MLKIKIEYFYLIFVAIKLIIYFIPRSCGEITMSFASQRGVNATARFTLRLAKLRTNLTSFADKLPSLAPTLKALNQIEAVLQRPLRLGVLGEANSGKSALTNLLLRVPVLPALQVPNTRVPTLLVYGERAEVIHSPVFRNSGYKSVQKLRPQQDKLILVRLPFASLKTCEILDVPGFLDPLLGYDVADIGGLGIDAAIWCTFSTQAWKESERISWARMPEKVRKAGLLAVTHMDLLRSDQIIRVKTRLKNVMAEDFKDLVFVSSLQAIEALNPAGNLVAFELWKQSGAAALDHALQELLGELRMQRLQKAQVLTQRVAEMALSGISV